MNRTLRRGLLVVSAVAATTLLTATVRIAWAELDGDASTSDVPQVLPYQGHLELDGAAYDGLMEMRFSLYDEAQGGDPAWTEEWTTEEGRAVEVVEGRFGVNLGADVPIVDLVADGEVLYLGIEVRTPPVDENAAPGEWTSLGGRQRINPVPYALWTARAADMAVAGALGVAGATQLRGGATVTGGATIQSGGLSVSAGGANITGDLSVTGSSTFTGNATITSNGAVGGTLVTGGSTTVGGHLTVNNTDVFLGANRATPGGRALVDNVANDRLFLNYENDFSGGTYIQGGVQVAGGLTVLGAASFGNTVAVDSFIRVSGAVSNPNGNLTINDALSVESDLSDPDSDLTVNDNLRVNNNLTPTANTWGTCEWNAHSAGTQANGEQFERFCQNGWFAAGYRRFNGQGFDYGIEQLWFYCCKL